MKAKTRRRIVLSLLSLILAYTILGFLVVPRILHWQILKILPAETGREVTLDKVRLNPFTFTLQLQAFRMLDLDGEPFVAFEAFSANYQPLAFLREGVVIKSMELEAPYLRVRRMPGNVLNFSDLLETEDTPATEDPDVPDSEKEPFLLHIDTLAVGNGTFVFEDTAPESRYQKEVRNISFRIDNFTTAPEEAGAFAFEAASGESESFELTGNIRLPDLEVTGVVGVENLYLPAFMPYIEHLLAAKVVNGTLTTRMEFALRPGEQGIDLVITNSLLDLENLTLHTIDATDDLISWDRLKIDFFEADLAQSRFEAGGVLLEGPGLFVHRHADGALNLLKAYIPPAEDTETPGAESAAPWTFEVVDIAVRGASVHWRDDAISEPVSLNLAIPSVELTRISNLPPSDYAIAITFKAEGEGSGTLTGEGSLFPISGDYALQLADWDLTPFNPYLADSMKTRLQSGGLGIDGKAQFHVADAGLDRLTVQADLRLSGMDIRETNEGQPIAAWKELDLKTIDLDWAERRISVESLNYLDPEMAFIIRQDGTRNIDVFVPAGSDESSPGPETEEPVETATAKDFTVSLDTFELTGGRFTFQDHQQDPAVRLAAEDTRLSVKGLSTDPASRPPLNMETRIMGTASLKVEGVLNPLAGDPFADLVVRMNGLSLDPFAPYFQRYVGFQLDGGALNIDMDYLIEDQRLTSENVLVVDQFALGARTDSPDATGLPVRLAVSLLRDPSGKIEVDVPIEGDLSDPSFRFGRVISRTVANLIVKIATSPFSVLAGLTNFSAEELQGVAFQPGRIALDEQAGQELDAIASVMAERPGIQLALLARPNPALDVPALKELELKRQLQAIPLPEGFAGTREAAIRFRVESAYYGNQPETEPPESTEELPIEAMEAALLESIEIPEEALVELSTRRLANARNYLIMEQSVDPARILIPEPETYETVADGPSEIRLEVR